MGFPSGAAGAASGDAAAFSSESVAVSPQPSEPLFVPARAPAATEMRVAAPTPSVPRDTGNTTTTTATTTPFSLRVDDGASPGALHRDSTDEGARPSTQHLAQDRGDAAHGGSKKAHEPCSGDNLPDNASAAAPPPPPARISLLALLNRENRKVAVVPLVGGLLQGYTVSHVPFYIQLYSGGTNCALYSTRTACESVPFADCVWHTASTTLADGTASTLQYCGWPTLTCRAAYPNDAWVGGGGNTTRALASCLGDAECTWSYSAAECQNPYGYTTTQVGIFAGSMIVGNMIGALFGGPIVTGMGTRLTFLVCGIFCTVACVMGHADAALDDFWMLISSRFILGLFVGLLTVACPLYVHENADPLYKGKIGLVFQVAAALGNFVTGIIGVCVGETIHYGLEADPNIPARLQAVTAGQTLFSVLVICLGFFSAETKVKFHKGVSGALDQNEHSYRSMWRQLLLGVVLTATFRFTGFNAVMNFGPKLMASYNISPYLGDFIILAANLAGGLLSFPGSLFMSPRLLFLIGSCFVSCMCLFLCGVPVYPGVAPNETVTNICAVVGICLFIFSYELFVGPSFYVLCQEIFPPSFRPRGNSFVQVWQFFFNLVINVCYALTVEHVSGGPAGDQHKGQAIVFIFFGGLGLLLFLYELLFLRLWDEGAEPERKRRGAAAAARLGADEADGRSDSGAALRADLNARDANTSEDTARL